MKLKSFYKIKKLFNFNQGIFVNSKLLNNSKLYSTDKKTVPESLKDIDFTLNTIKLKDKFLKSTDLEYVLEQVKSNKHVCHVKFGTIAPNARKHQIKIEEQVMVNNAKYRYYPTDFVYVLLSAHVYMDSNEEDNVVFPNNSTNEKYNCYLKNWKVDKVYNKNNGMYYAISYKNDIDRQLVLAHRGTDTDIDTIRDLLLTSNSWKKLNDDLEFKQTCAQAVTKELTEYSKNCNYSFSTTGHSIGALLSISSLFFCHKNFNYHTAKAVVFESPGSYSQLKNLNYSNNKEKVDSIDLTSLNITNYLSRPNFANCCDEHVGKKYSVNTETAIPNSISKALKCIKWSANKLAKTNIKLILMFTGLSWVKMFFPTWLQKLPKFKDDFIIDAFSSIYNHYLANITNQFDPETGKPHSYYEILEWPIIKYRSDHKSNDSTINTPVSIQDILENILNDKLDLKEYYLFFKYAKDTKVIDFMSTHKLLKYGQKEVDLYRDYYIEAKDYCLKQLKETSNSQINNSFDSLIAKQLVNLKKYFKLVQKQDEFIIISEGQGNKKLTIDDLRERISRLCEIDNSIRKKWKNSSTNKVKEELEVSNTFTDTFGTEENQNFIGRQQEFDDLDKILVENKYALITGLPGVGKSSLAIEYARSQYIANKVKVRYFDSTIIKKLYDQYLSLAKNLNISVKNLTKEDLINEINGELAIQHKKMIFIFSNVVKYEDIKPYIINLPKNVKILITSSDPDLIPQIQRTQHIKLTLLDTDNSITYLKQVLPDRNESDLKKLIEAIGSKQGCLPHKLNEAVTYLTVNFISTIDTYTEPHKPDEDRKIIYNIPFVRSSKEWELLEYCSFLDSNFISIELIKKLLVTNEKELQNCLKVLKKLSLVEINIKESSLKLDELTQNNVKKEISKSRQEKIMNKLTETLNCLMPSVDNAVRTGWKIDKLLYGHIKKIALSTKSNYKYKITSSAADLIHKFALYHEHVFNNYQEALKYYECSLLIRKKLYQGEHTDIAISLNGIGDSYWKLGDKVKAIELYKQAYLMNLKILKTQHPSTKKAKNLIQKVSPDFFNNNETRKFILKTSIFDNDILKVKLQIQSSILNIISQKAQEGKWNSNLILSLFSSKANYGVLGYIEDNYLKKKLGELVTDKNLKFAEMLCFEAINLGIMSSSKKEKDFTCAKEFAKLYPDLVRKIAKEHPEYFVDGRILKACKDIAKIDDELVAELLEESKKSVDSKEVIKDETKDNQPKKVEDEKTESTEESKIKSPNDILDSSTNEIDQDSQVSGGSSGLEDGN